MKSINCDVIKDLLPSYIDKISTSSTNELIEEHLSNCKDCCSTLKDMNEDIYIESINSQKNQINYLKKYKKSKILTIIFTIIITINIIIGSLLLLYRLSTIDFYVDVNDINTYINIEKGVWGEKRFVVSLSSEKFIILCHEDFSTDESGNKILYLKVFGKLPSLDEIFDKSKKPETIRYGYDINDIENIQKICIEDQKGNLKEIWNRDIGI